jgi:hypothetical protein
MKNILIASPSFETVYVDYAASLVNNVLFLNAKKYNCIISFHAHKHTYVYEARHKIVEYAKELNSTHILWVDTDMNFPNDAFYRLLNHDLDFVGVNYSTKVFPYRFTAAVKTDPFDDETSFTSISTNDETFGLQKVDGIGFGLCVTSTHLFDKIEQPYFKCEWLEKQKTFRGEDYQFCADIGKFTDIYIDHDLSKEISHVGSTQYTYEVPSLKF